MLKQLVKRWLFGESPMKSSFTDVGADRLTGDLPLGMYVYPISNGYLMRTESLQENRCHLTYAPNETGIAEEIIANQARHKLGVGGQGELFPTDKTAQYAQSVSTKQRTTP